MFVFQELTATMAFSYQAWGTIWRGPCLPARTSWSCVLLSSISWGFRLFFSEALATKPTDTSMKTRNSILLCCVAFLFLQKLFLLFDLCSCVKKFLYVIPVPKEGIWIKDEPSEPSTFRFVDSLWRAICNFQVHSTSWPNCETQNSSRYCALCLLRDAGAI